jgi:hypothetical protein
MPRSNRVTEKTTCVILTSLSPSGRLSFPSKRPWTLLGNRRIDCSSWPLLLGTRTLCHGNDSTNVNTVYAGAVVQFTPIGLYSDGSQHPLLNTTFDGFGGTWTSSNPLLMYINQAGLSWANSQGTAIIRYTAPGGVNFSEWIMYVTAPTE